MRDGDDNGDDEDDDDDDYDDDDDDDELTFKHCSRCLSKRCFSI